MTDAQKRWIDSQGYQGLLGRWRNAPVGDPMFQGVAGEYYTAAMKRKREEEADGGVSASKAVGW